MLALPVQVPNEPGTYDLTVYQRHCRTPIYRLRWAATLLGITFAMVYCGQPTNSDLALCFA